MKNKEVQKWMHKAKEFIPESEKLIEILKTKVFTDLVGNTKQTNN